MQRHEGGAAFVFGPGKPSAKPEHGETFIKNPMRVDFAAEIKYNDIYHRKNYREV